MKLLPAVAAAAAAAAARGAAGGGGAAAARRPLLGCHPVTGAPGPSLLPPSRAPALAPPAAELRTGPEEEPRAPRLPAAGSAGRCISRSPALGRPPPAPRSRAGLLSGRKRSLSGRLRLPAPTPPRSSSPGPSSPSHFPSRPAPPPASQHPRPGAPPPSSQRVGSTDLISGARVPEPPTSARNSLPARLPQPTAGYVPA